MRPFHCPKCQLEQPRTNAECPSCQIIFAKWIQKEFGPKPEASETTTATHEAAVSFSLPQTDKIKAALTKAFTGTVVLYLAWDLLLAPPKGLPMPEKAYVDQDYQFAVAAPQGWTLDPIKEVREKDYISVLHLTGPAASSSVPARASVVVSDEWTSTIQRNLGERLPKLVSVVFAGNLKAYTREAKDTVEIDRMKTFRIWGSATEVVTTVETVWAPAEQQPWQRRTGNPPPMVSTTQSSTENRPMKFAIHLVPGADRTYLIGISADAAQFDAQSKAFDGLLSSFRVMKRPWSWAHLLRMFGGHLRGELIMAFIGLVFAFYKWVFSPLFEE